MRTPILPLIGLAILLAIGLIHCTAAWGQSIPPAEFDKPYEGWLMIEHAHSQDDVRQRCRGGAFPGPALACSMVREDAPRMCVIVKLSDDTLRTSGYDPDLIMRHELAHCNGWPGDHRRAR